MSTDAFVPRERALVHAPTTFQVVQAIARREINIALKRRLVKLLFLGNLLPPLVMAILLVVRIFIQSSGFDLDWDMLVRFIQIQAGPVLFLALAIGTPSVARDRSEDVLFLYATRPVTPLSYTLGKLAAVAFPAVALLFIPGLLIAILRLGLLEDVSAVDSAILLAKVGVASVFVACGYAGVSVGSSAATRKARWALLTAFACLVLPHVSRQILLPRSEFSLDAPHAVEALIANLFEGNFGLEGYGAIAVLLAWGILGAAVTMVRARTEMTP